MQEQEQDVVYIVNKLSPVTSFYRNGQKVIFEYDKPVKVSYASDPDFIKVILAAPELSLCSTAERVALVRLSEADVENKELKAKAVKEEAEGNVRLAEETADAAREETLSNSPSVEEEDEADEDEVDDFQDENDSVEDEDEVE